MSDGTSRRHAGCSNGATWRTRVGTGSVLGCGACVLIIGREWDAAYERPKPKSQPRDSQTAGEKYEAIARAALLHAARVVNTLRPEQEVHQQCRAGDCKHHSDQPGGDCNRAGLHRGRTTRRCRPNLVVLEPGDEVLSKAGGTGAGERRSAIKSCSRIRQQGKQKPTARNSVSERGWHHREARQARSSVSMKRSVQPRPLDAQTAMSPFERGFHAGVFAGTVAAATGFVVGWLSYGVFH
jgi:hypothetical protein